MCPTLFGSMHWNTKGAVSGATVAVERCSDLDRCPAALCSQRRINRVALDGEARRGGNTGVRGRRQILGGIRSPSSLEQQALLAVPDFTISQPACNSPRTGGGDE